MLLAVPANAVAIVGVWLLTTRLLVSRLHPALSSRLPEPAAGASGWLLLALSWLLGVACRGCIASWCFYCDLGPSVALGINTALGGFGLVSGFFWLKKGYSAGWLSMPAGGALSRPECGVAALSVLLLAAYTWRAGAPWNDHDEMAVYGFISKQIAIGSSCTRINDLWAASPHHGPRMIQALDAQLMLTGAGTLIPRLHHLAGILAMSVVVLITLTALGRRWLCGLLGVTGILSTPELGYLGVSLKPDAAVMCFELPAMLLGVLTFACWKDDTAPNRERQWLLILAGILAGASFGSRQSGIYLLCVLGGMVLFIQRTSRTRGMPILLAYAFIAAFFSPSYWRNLADFGNPLYPFQMGQPFADGKWLVTVETYRRQYNILLPPVIREFYLLFHLGLAVESWPAVGWLANLPAAAHRTVSMGWLSPAILGVLILPLFLKKVKGLGAILALFAALHVIWCSGVHYSRVFLAGGSLPVLGVALCAGVRDKWHGVFRLWKNMLGAAFGMTLAALTCFHCWQAAAYPHTAGAFISSDARVDACRRLVHRSYRETDVPARELQQAWKDAGCPPESVVLAACRSGRVVSIFFPGGFFVDDMENAIAHGAEYAIVNRRFVEDKPWRHAMTAAFPCVLAEIADGRWQLRGRNRADCVR